jgi:hypothetical protein
MLVMSLGLGVTWAAWQIAPGDTSAMHGGVVFAQEPAAAVPEEETAGKKLAERLEEIEAAMAVEGEVTEFKPSEPLPADIAIDMSSEL